MTAKHTPGPWVRDTAGGLKGDVRGANGRWVAGCWGLGSGNNYRTEYKAECYANANLIAAAPDLLEALKDLLAVASVRIDDPRIAQWDAARAAIAKATGSAA